MVPSFMPTSAFAAEELPEALTPEAAESNEPESVEEAPLAAADGPINIVASVSPEGSGTVTCSRLDEHTARLTVTPGAHYKLK